jgi:predicted dehydrogenase
MPGPLRTLVVGLGRAGAGLHLPVLAKARERQPRCFAAEPVVGFDPDPAARARCAGSGVRPADSPARARAELDPARTVVHVCTPPVARLGAVAELVGLGFRMLVLEKPLAADPGDLVRLLGLLRTPGVRAAVVAPWLASTLTERLARLVREPGGLGALRTVSVLQNKPRFHRSLATAGHPTAFDVEVPHALGVLLHLAGDAEVVAASCTDLDVGGRRVPRLGGAALRLAHHGGVSGAVRSDLTSPVRERRITLRFEHGAAIGHYPADSSDDHAQLRVVSRESATALPAVFRDDALTAFVLRAYADFAAGGPGFAGVERQARVVELLCDAKALALAGGHGRGRERELTGAR